jgi:hypothetical protein
MRKMLLVLGSLVMIPASASADAHGMRHRQVFSSVGLSIVVREAPKVVQHHHHPVRHLRPQPWPRHFKYHAPRFSWHKPWRPGPRRFDRHWGGDKRWFGGHDRRSVRDGRPHWRGHNWGPAVRHHGPDKRSFDHRHHDGRRRR